MRLDTMTWADLPKFEGRELVLFGSDANAAALMRHIASSGLKISFKLVLDFCEPRDFFGIPGAAVETWLDERDLKGETVVIANTAQYQALNALLYSDPDEVWLCSRLCYKMFHSKDEPRTQTAVRAVSPFMMQRGTPPADVLTTNAYEDDGHTVYEIADFRNQEFITWTVPQPSFPIDLPDFSSRVRLSDLPMRMSHLSYLLWKRTTHAVQLSYSRRHIVAPRYNFFHLDILDTKTGLHTRWHDLPPSEGLWDYVATGDFDDNEEAFYFCRWPVEDAIRGMADGSNRVRMQVGKLNLDDMRAEILHEFDFQDRVHQCTISGDGRYMVFAPMRMLLPKENLKKLREAEVMRRLQEWVTLDSMATLDLRDKKTWTTEIPCPIPAHFELDPLDPHLFYVSTHSLMPHAEGVICFQPATLHKVRIHDGETRLEGVYTHPGFIRTIQHCPFVFEGKVLIAATNQNKLEIIDAADMSLWHCHKLVDDPRYDTADFSDPAFLSKPFTLPSRPHHCDSISASADGRHLVLRMTDCFLLFDVARKEVVGKVLYRDKLRAPGHARGYMQNAPHALALKRYAEWAAARDL